MTIRCKYSCHACGLERAVVDVPARTTESVTDWMDATIRILGKDHHRRSPDCHPEVLNDVMIPITGSDKLGGAAVS